MTGVKRTLKPKENFQKYISFGFPSAKKTPIHNVIICQRISVNYRL